MSGHKDHPDIHRVAALRIVSLYRSGAHALLDDYRALWHLSRWSGIDLFRVARELVAAFDQRDMDRMQLPRIPASMLPEHTYTRCGEWISDVTGHDRRVPTDFLDVVEDVGGWLYAVRSTIVDIAAREVFDDRLQVGVPAPIAMDNVISLTGYHVGARR